MSVSDLEYELRTRPENEKLYMGMLATRNTTYELLTRIIELERKVGVFNKNMINAAIERRCHTVEVYNEAMEAYERTVSEHLNQEPA